MLVIDGLREASLGCSGDRTRSVARVRGVAVCAPFMRGPR